MSTNSILSKIRQEIERHRQAIRVLNEHTAPEQMSKTCAIFQYSDSILSELLSFLDTLSEEPVQKFNTDKLQEVAKPATPRKKPTPEDRTKFMKELHEYAESKKPDKSLEEAAQQNSDKYAVEDILERPYHYVDDAFIAGAEWQASQMPMPEDTVLFNKGVAEGRRLEREDMMKDAVDGEICGRVYDHINVRFADGVCKYLEPKNISHIPADVSKYNIGDKVRILVLKEEEDKK